MASHRIAIVGVGPKGLYAFERLLAQLHNTEIWQGVEVHLFEKSGNFGAGAIYDPCQPDFLMMNYPNRNISVWSTEFPSVPIQDMPSFSEWLAEKTFKTCDEVNDQFASRATVGTYLTDCFEKLNRHGCTSCKIIKHVSTVENVLLRGKHYDLEYKDYKQNHIKSLKVQSVMIATGHCSWKGRLEKNSFFDYNEASKNSWIPFVYPVDEKLSPIGNNSRVAIKGLGLTFIDTVLALTEGHGGRFTKKTDGSMSYEPSQREPKVIYAFSRSGMPMIPRSSEEGKDEYTLQYFTHKAIYGQIGNGEKPNFIKHILPLFKLETKYRYYKIAFENIGLTLYPEENAGGLERQIAIFHETYPNEPRFNFENLFRPVKMANASVQIGSKSYLKYLVKEAALGSQRSPFMAAAMTWGKLSEVFNSIYNFGGMTPDSHCLFDQKYRSKLNRISYGPPLENMGKILALLETGILNLDFCENPDVRPVNGTWQIADSDRNLVEVNTLIDARIPTNSTQNDWSPLLKNMHKNGLIREFVLPGNSNNKTGSPEIDRKGNVIGRNGKVNDDITLYGTLTEGVTYDNDTLARGRNNFSSVWALTLIEQFSGVRLE